jgi:hypothetical protein
MRSFTRNHIRTIVVAAGTLAAVATTSIQVLADFKMH